MKMLNVLERPLKSEPRCWSRAEDQSNVPRASVRAFIRSENQFCTVAGKSDGILLSTVAASAAMVVRASSSRMLCSARSITAWIAQTPPVAEADAFSL